MAALQCGRSSLRAGVRGAHQAILRRLLLWSHEIHVMLLFGSQDRASPISSEEDT